SPVADLTLIGAKDLTLTTFAATTRLAAASTGGNLVDDGVDSTSVAAKDVILFARGRVGGRGKTDQLEAIGQSNDFLGAIDVDLQGGLLTVTQGRTGGNVQLREVNGGLTTGAASLDLTGVNLGTNKQLALISSGGDLSVAQSLTLPAS